MKHILLILFLALLAVSCKQVVYPEPQPPRVKALDVFPEELRGAYLDNDLDTLLVKDRSYIYNSANWTFSGEELLSDSTVLKSFRGKYFYNRGFTVEGEVYWVCYVIDPVGNAGQLDVYTMSADDMVKMAMLQEITPKVSDLDLDGDELYLFSPKKRHYKKIFRDTVLTKFVTFTRIPAPE